MVMTGFGIQLVEMRLEKYSFKNTSLSVFAPNISRGAFSPKYTIKQNHYMVFQVGNYKVNQ
jgi:hypothetical protein